MAADDPAAAFGAPPPDPEIRRLEPLLGSWRAEDHTNDSVLGRAVPVRSLETYSWLDGGYFLVNTYETVFGDQPAQKGVNYRMYDSKMKRVNPDGTLTVAWWLRDGANKWQLWMTNTFEREVDGWR